MNKSAIDGLNDIECFVLFLTVFAPGEYGVNEFRRRYGECVPVHVSMAKMESVCSALENIGVLQCKRRYATVSSNRYKLNALFDQEALVSLLGRSIANGWWKVFEVDSNTGLPQPNQRGYFLGGGYSLRDGQEEALMLWALIDATGLQVDLTDGYRVTDAAWIAARNLMRIIDPYTKWQWPTRVLGPANPLSLHLKLLSLRFIRGQDVRQSVAAIGESVAAGRLRLSDCNLCEVASLAVLTGVSVDFSNAKNWEIAAEAKAFADVAALLQEGNLAVVNKMCGDAFKTISELSSLLAPAFNFLAILVNVFHKPSATRVKQHLRVICPSETYHYYYRDYGERAIISDRNSRLTAMSAMLYGMTPDSDPVADDFIDNLTDPISALVNGVNRDMAKANAQFFFRSAQVALEHGYPTVAGVFLSVYGWAIPEQSRGYFVAVADAIAKAGGIFFKPVDATATEWKRVLEELSARLPKTVVQKSTAHAKVKTGSIRWALAIEPMSFAYDGESKKALKSSNLGCARIVPFFRRPRAAEDGSDDKQVTLKSIYGGKYDGCLTEQDRAVVAALHKGNYDGGRSASNVSSSALEALCGQDNVMSYIGDMFTKPKDVESSQLIRQDIPLVGKSDSSGAMELSVPQWCLNTSADYIIRMTGESDYTYYPLSRTVRSVLEVFRDFGDKGTMKIPKEAMETAKPIFGRLASVLPLQGSLADVGGASGMARVNGDTTPLVRLALDEMRLNVSVRVRPVTTAPSALFEPGVGQAERTLTLPKGPVIVVRDLKQEKKCAAAVEEALAEFGSCREGAWEWQIYEVEESLAALAAIQALGKDVSVEWRPGKRLSVFRPTARPTLSASLGADEWFAVSGEWHLDDGRVIAIAKLLEQFDNRVGSFVPIDENGFLSLNRALMRQLEALRAAGQVSKGRLAVSPAALPMLDGAFAAEKSNDAMALPKAIETAASRIREVFASVPPAPEGFKGVMRPYQEEGYQWLSRLCDCNIGACLADDMGLGKTIQIIALLAAKRSRGPSLVVAPASVAFNWRNELARFAPSLRVALVGQTPGAGEENVAELAKSNDVIVTSYGVEASRLESFSCVDWNVVVLDEAQAIKNHLTQRAKSVKELKARFRIAATGTPVENRLTELWSIFDFINPGMLGGETRFNRELAPHGMASPRLKRLVKPLILRRIKRDVLTDLPEKEEITVSVILGDDERTAYEATRMKALSKLQSEDPENKIAILAELTRLRRFCCHPSLVLPDLADSAKLDALVRLLAGLKENGHHALVFSQFVDYLAIVRAALERNGWTYEYLDGATSKPQREQSVARFQAGNADFFLISLKAGGMGLNLTAANYVILLDPWWNPAVENQAADRAHRIGQRLPVTVYRLIAKDTIEEKVVELHAKKTALAEDVLATGAAAMSAQEMLGLLRG